MGRAARTRDFGAGYTPTMRVVSLACSNTEIVCALGRAHLLVGVDDHSDHPAEVVERLPRVGPDLEIDVEAVAALRPDLVLATLTVPGHEDVVARLEDAGLPFVAPEPTCLDDVYEDVQEIAALLGVPGRGVRLAEEMRRELGRRPDPAEGEAGGEPRREREAPEHVDAGIRKRSSDATPSVLVQWWPKPTIAPGRRSWTTEIIEAAGGRNPLAADDVKSRPVSDEEVAEIAPDAIVLSWCGVHPSKYRPDVVYGKESWAEVPAVRRGQVHCVPEAFLGRPGPRLVEGVRLMRHVVDEARTAAGRDGGA